MQFEYSIRVQMLEIYTEQIRDLISAEERRLDIRSTERSGHNVPDAIQARSSKTLTTQVACMTADLEFILFLSRRPVAQGCERATSC